MIKGKLKYAFLLFISLSLLWGCGTDDNNPSPVPDARDKFTGSWNVNDENCGKGKYVVNISKDASNGAQVLITNFAFSNSGTPSTGVVAGSTLQVYKQTNSVGWTIEGSGNYNSNGSINWAYSLIISGTQEDCTCTYTQ